MITHFHIENFKSLVNFDLPPAGQELSPFTCLVGLNGAGKSTLLQAFDFIAQVATGGVSEWLARREWVKSELVSNLDSKLQVITFTVRFRTPEGQNLEWSARFNTTHLKCTAETIKVFNEPILKLVDGRLWLLQREDGKSLNFEKVPFEYQGSVLSTLNLADARAEIGEVKCALQSLRSLELLSPQLMRRKARAADDIGAGGEKLSPFLDQLKLPQKAKLLEMLREFYPELTSWNIKGYRAGWKSLRILESFAEDSPVSVGHINDGLMRVIAILSQTFTSHRTLLLDEIENGINPALVERLMDFLVGLGREGKQVIVTTHSPVILNYLNDPVAREGVILLYKRPDGQTKSVRYFDLPETGYKLNALGPGEVFVDTDLTKLVKRLAASSVQTGASQ